MATDMSENLANLQRAIEAWNAGDLDRYLELYDEGIRLHGYSPVPMTKDQVRGFYSMIFAAFPSSQLTVDEEVVDGDRVALRFTQTGVHKGEFMGVEATGREFAMAGQTILHFSGGRVIERWSSADMLGLLQQLGALPTP
jgi:steroid delta-isomerase-like uncharacterized protein